MREASQRVGWARRARPGRAACARLALGSLAALSASALAALAGCLHAERGESRAARFQHPSPSARERYCAWYADARDGTLYFGASAFWSSLRAHGNDPLADLLEEGPVVIGRFDLHRERMLAPLEVGRAGDRSGVWDVLAHPNGRIYFTTFFESAGYTDPSSGTMQRLRDLGTGLNELALGPGDSVLASRYDAGSVAHFDPDGALLGEYALDAPDGYRAAPKTLAYDPLREQIWVTSDSLPLDPDDPMRHDSYVIGAAGEPLQRSTEPELQFVRFARDGTGYRAEVEGRELWLQISAPGAGPQSGARILLDAAFPAALDFVQDIELMRDGRAVVTRWSGWIHVVESTRVVRTTRLPELEAGGLYYSAFAERDRICATYCADLSVVCAALP